MVPSLLKCLSKNTVYHDNGTLILFIKIIMCKVPHIVHSAYIRSLNLTLWAQFSVFAVVSGLVHPHSCISSFLLPVLFLLGSDRGMAVLHGGDWPPQESHHTQAFPVSWLGWGFYLLSIILLLLLLCYYYICCDSFYLTCVFIFSYSFQLSMVTASIQANKTKKNI